MLKRNFAILLFTFAFIHSVNASVKPSPELIREFFTVTNAEQTLKMSLGPVKKALDDQLDAAYKKIRAKYSTNEQDEILKKRFSEISKFVDKQVGWEKVELFVIDAYQKEFTQKELEDAIAFYKSESGHAMLQKLPNVFKHMNTSMAPLDKEVTEYMNESLMVLSKELDATK